VKRVMFALCAVLLLAGGARADEFVVPKQVVQGADSPVPLGEMVDLSLSPVPDPKPQYLASTSEVWHVFDVDPASGKLTEKRVREYSDSDGRRGVFFGAGVRNKRMLVVVAVTHLYVVRDDKDPSRVTRVATKTVLLTADLVVGSPDPVPPAPDPTPGPKPPPPGPSLPDGKFGLAKFVYDQVVANTPADTRVKWCQAHVKAYRNVVAQVKAGGLKDARAVLVETGKQVAAAKKDAGLTGDPGWAKVADAVEEKLYGLYTDRKLNSAEDFGQALDELAAGLDAIK
jgi:hypothetical protein